MPSLSYPHEMVFALPARDPRRTAIVQAAAALALAVRAEPATITVTLQQQAYQFGKMSHTFLKGLTAPEPELPPRTEDI